MMTTVPFGTQREDETSGAWTCAKLAVTGVAVTGFWVFAFFVIIPALLGK